VEMPTWACSLTGAFDPMIAGQLPVPHSMVPVVAGLSKSVKFMNCRSYQSIFHVALRHP
jgi:hypothetical protein